MPCAPCFKRKQQQQKATKSNKKPHTADELSLTMMEWCQSGQCHGCNSNSVRYGSGDGVAFGVSTAGHPITGRGSAAGRGLGLGAGFVDVVEDDNYSLGGSWVRTYRTTRQSGSSSGSNSDEGLDVIWAGRERRYTPCRTQEIFFAHRGDRGEWFWG